MGGTPRTASQSASTCQSNNAKMFLTKSARTFRGNSATRCPNRSATQFTPSSVNQSHPKNVSKFQCWCPEKSANQYLSSDAKVCPRAVPGDHQPGVPERAGRGVPRGAKHNLQPGLTED